MNSVDPRFCKIKFYLVSCNSTGPTRLPVF